MKLETYVPCEALKPFVQSLIIQEVDEESTYNVLPGTGLVIGFQYKGRLSRIDGTGEKPLSLSGISGLADTNHVFRNSADIGTVLVIFRASGAAPFFLLPLHELFRESVSLDNFMLRSELLCLEEKLCEAKAGRTRITAVEKFLLARMATAPADPLVTGALALLHQTCGTIRIAELAKRLHTSQSPLEKKFRAAVGTSPKKFANIIRMKHLIKSYRAANSLTELGYAAGFYDQAYFIKEFKTFTGETPENFFLAKS